MVDIREESAGVAGEEVPGDEQNGYHPDEEISWQAIWNAPDYASLVNVRQSRRAKEYTAKINSGLKSATFASMQAGRFDDAAAILHNGPPWAHAVGSLADQNKHVAGAIDMLTSPNSPLAMTIVTTIALAGQLMRNHEAEIKEIPNARKRAKAEKKARKTTADLSPPRFTVKFMGRQWPIRFRSRIKLGPMLAMFKAQTKHPDQLAAQVFSDPRLLAALERQGVTIRHADTPR